MPQLFLKLFKEFVNKAEAEKEHSFRLYQGGVVPGDTLRVVNIEGIDVEACSGTHCDNTSEVGIIRILKTNRVSDGIIRLYFVAGEKSLQKLQIQTKVLVEFQNIFKVKESDLVSTSFKFFKERNKFIESHKSASQKVLTLQMELFLAKDKHKNVFVKSTESETTLYFSFMANFIKSQKNSGKGIVFVGEGGKGFVFGQFGNKADFDHEKFLQLLQEDNLGVQYKKCQTQLTANKVKLDNVLQFSFNCKVRYEKVKKDLISLGITEADL